MANELLPTEVCVCPLYQGRNIRKMLLPGFRNVTSPCHMLGDASGLSEGGKKLLWLQERVIICSFGS